MNTFLLVSFAGLAHVAAALPLTPNHGLSGRGPSTQAEQLGYDGGPAEVERTPYGGDELRGDREQLEDTHGPDECLGNLLDGFGPI